MNQDLYLYELMKRIVRGRFYITYNSKQILCRDLLEDEFLILQDLYNNKYQEAIQKGLMSDEQVVMYGIEQGKWKPEYDLDALRSQIKLLKDQIRLNRFKINIVESLYNQIKDKQKELSDLEKKYNDLFDYSSARFVANMATVYKTIELMIEDKISIIDSNVAVVLYSELNKHFIDVSEIRKLARSSIWANRYSAAKNHIIAPIFPSILDLTQYQSLLLVWSATYEYARNHIEPPPDSVIDDDDAFDKWLRDDAKKNNISDNDKGEEVFIMADSKGAKEVYNLNTEKSKKFIEKTLQLVKQKGRVSEQERVRMLSNSNVDNNS